MKTAKITKVYPDSQTDTGHAYAVYENGTEICWGGPVTREVAIHNCLTSGAELPNILPTDLGVDGVLEALSNEGYTFTKDEIKAARFVGWSPSGAVYQITYVGEESDDETGNVYVTERGGKLVAEF